MLNEDELRDALLLVFANKQDLPNAMSASEITEKLGLPALKQRTWYIQVSLSTNDLRGITAACLCHHYVSDSSVSLTPGCVCNEW